MGGGRGAGTSPCRWGGFRFQHLLAQGRGTLGLFLRFRGQLLQLLLLLGRQLIGLGAEELLLELGNIGSCLGQLIDGLAEYIEENF